MIYLLFDWIVRIITLICKIFKPGQGGSKNISREIILRLSSPLIPLLAKGVPLSQIPLGEGGDRGIEI